MTSWTSSRPDVRNEAYTAAETQSYRTAKVEMMSNHVLRFVSEIQSLVNRALSMNRKPIRHDFSRARLEADLEPHRSVLNGFYEGEITLDVAESVLRPFVVENVSVLGLNDMYWFTRSALRSIEKIKI